MTAKADPVAFAAELISVIFDDDADEMEVQAIAEMAERHGLILSRRPTEAELSDPDWWGHEYGITEDDETVMERTPAFEAMLPELQAA